MWIYVCLYPICVCVEDISVIWYKNDLKNVFVKQKADFNLDDKQYYDGKLASGIKEGKFYKSGKLGTGMYSGKYYVNGNLADGLVNRVLYQDTYLHVLNKILKYKKVIKEKQIGWIIKTICSLFSWIK